MAQGDVDSIRIGATIAMLDSNQGIGYKGDLPWPHIKEDVDYFMGIVTETKDPEKKNGIILGRISWNELLRKRSLKLHPKLSYVITCNKTPPNIELCRAVKPNFDEAVEELSRAVKEGDIEKIFVLGGSRNYGIAVEDKRLQTIHVTRIFDEFPVDKYFPPFSHLYHKVSTSDMKVDNNNGIKFQFEIWQRNEV